MTAERRFEGLSALKLDAIGLSTRSPLRGGCLDPASGIVRALRKLQRTLLDATLPAGQLASALFARESTKQEVPLFRMSVSGVHLRSSR